MTSSARAFALLLLVASCDDDTTVATSSDASSIVDAAVVDQSAAADLSIACIVMDFGAGPDGGLCGAPTDCSGTSCCAVVNVRAGSSSTLGASSCGATCPGAFLPGCGTDVLDTKLCASNADCTGFSGLVSTASNMSGQTPFDHCCSIPGLTHRMCGYDTTALGGNITCDP